MSVDHWAGEFAGKLDVLFGDLPDDVSVDHWAGEFAGISLLTVSSIPCVCRSITGPVNSPAAVD